MSGSVAEPSFSVYVITDYDNTGHNLRTEKWPQTVPFTILGFHFSVPEKPTLPTVVFIRPFLHSNLICYCIVNVESVLSWFVAVDRPVLIVSTYLLVMNLRQSLY